MSTTSQALTDAITRIDTITDLKGRRPTRWEYQWLNPNDRPLEPNESYRTEWRPLDVYFGGANPTWDNIRRELLDTLHYRADSNNKPLYAIRPVWDNEPTYGNAFNGG